MVETNTARAGNHGGHSAIPRSSSAMATAISRKRSAVPVAAAPKKRPEASLVFLRVKRRRTDTPVARLVVQGEEKQPEAEQKQEEQEAAPTDALATQRDLLKAFTKLSTREKSFVFTHIDTMETPLTSATSHSKWTERLKKKARSLKDEHAELRARRAAPTASPFLQDASLLGSTSSASTRQRAPMIQKQQKLARERRQSDVQRARGLLDNDNPVVEIKEQGTVELPGIRLVDLEAVRIAKGKAAVDTDTKATACSTPEVTVNGARLRPTRVLNPGERDLDEAIWAAFQRNDFSRFFAILNSQRPEIRAKPAMFQRPADGGSALMAAALHGRADVIEVLLRHSPASVLLQDWEGALASTFARRGGHESVEKALLACEEAENDKEFVYDVYCVDVSQDGSGMTDASSRPGSASTSTADATMTDGPTAQAPVVTVSSAVQQWLSQDASAQADEVEEYMLESDAGSHEGSDDESVDSNDEDFFANDYPDEESSDSDADSDGWDEIGGPKRYNAAQDDYTERDDFDY